MVNAERDAEEGLKELKRIQREYNTEHLKVYTMKIFKDGTQKIHTAATSRLMWMFRNEEFQHEIGWPDCR